MSKGDPVKSQRRPLRHIARFVLIGLYTETRAGGIASASPYAEPGRSLVDLERGILYRKPIGKRATKLLERTGLTCHPTSPAERCLPHRASFPLQCISEALRFDPVPKPGPRSTDGRAIAVATVTKAPSVGRSSLTMTSGGFNVSNRNAARIDSTPPSHSTRPSSPPSEIVICNGVWLERSGICARRLTAHSAARRWQLIRPTGTRLSVPGHPVAVPMANLSR
jgi:hypothetical protein